MLTLFGPLSLVWPLLFAIASTCLLSVYAVRAGRLFDAFPSLSWTIFMQVPFILVSSSFNADIAQVQLTGILLVGGALLIGDYVSLRYAVRLIPPTSSAATAFQTFATAALMLLVLCLPTYHVLVAGKLPILDLLSSQTNNSETVLSREAFGKLLEVPVIIKYAFNWVLTFLAPILIALLLYRGQRILASAVFLWVCIYAVLSTASQPLLTFLIFTGFTTIGLCPKPIVKLARLFGVLALAAIAFVGTTRTINIVQYQNEKGQNSADYQDYLARPASNDGLRNLTAADAYRLSRLDREASLMKVIDYLNYRTQLTPVEVSYYWYTYFLRISDGPRDLQEVLGQRREGVAHASNRVGLWAYSARFPEQYGFSNNSYASIDADSHAFAGIPGICVASALLLVVRVFGGVLGSMVMGGIPGRLVSGQLGLFSIGASLQAILVAQGLFLLLVLIFCSLISRRVSPRSRKIRRTL